MVEEVEDFTSELQAEAFGYEEFFCGGDVGLDDRGPGQSVAADVSVGARQRLNESGRIEILIGIAADELSCEIGIDRRSDGIARVAIVRRVVGKLRSERQTGLESFDSADLPIAEGAANPCIRVGAAREGEIIRCVDHGGVTDVERCSTVVPGRRERIGDECRGVRQVRERGTRD